MNSSKDVPASILSKQNANLKPANCDKKHIFIYFYPREKEKALACLPRRISFREEDLAVSKKHFIP